jgi:hypothetical protein
VLIETAADPAVDPALARAKAAAQANHRAWIEVLDRLERDVAAHEELLRRNNPFQPFEPEPWQPPEVNGPLPDALLPRAREIHQRQTAVKAALAKAMVAIRAQQRRSDRPQRNTATAPATPAYVDVSA